MASETGFIRDNLEKVFRLCDILQYINKEEIFVDNLALKGGTAINLMVLDMPRLSVDIDFDFTKECGREEMFETREQINETLLNFMYAQAYALSPNTKNPHSLDSWVFYFQNAGGNRDNIKVEINYSMRNHVFPSLKKKINIDFLNFRDEITTLSTLELFGSKLSALIYRSVPRDLYDVNNMLKYNIFNDCEREVLRKTVIFYLVVGGYYGKIDWDYAKIKNMNFTVIRRGLIPLLRKTEHFDFESAKTAVLNYLHDLMKLTDSEKLFIENFNSGIYSPKLLFDDYQIVKRIENHPMALWKIEQI
ncbi:MAG: nucleotidyl transferase AbiEii/AbiGii toxin family protein [Prevotellaceae bacterium]|nr:nucleotidyl transferase AbiEii/AbiGii toxin family protein [Prevotellaceae bacterium]